MSGIESYSRYMDGYHCDSIISYNGQPRSAKTKYVCEQTGGFVEIEFYNNHP